MSVTINGLWFIGALLWVLVGSVFAWKLAISGTAVFVLVLLWPIFAVLILLSPAINAVVNRRHP
jgi:hypothetical protein